MCAHGSLYLVSTDRGTITRLSLEGRVLSETSPFRNFAADDEEYVYWGMCRGPHGHLCVLRRPTPPRPGSRRLDGI